MMIKKFIMCLCLLALSCSLPTDLLAASSFKINAKSAILINAATGKVLYTKNADKTMQPASLTKILSLYLVHEAINEGKIYPSDGVNISVNAQLTGGSSMYLVEETEVDLENLIRGIAVVSANDAAVAVAEHLGGNEVGFVKMMNAKAKTLGMKRSHFKNPNGLPAKNQLSTARDMARLARAYIHDFPESLNLHAMQSFTFHDITQSNQNILLQRCPGVDGLKTGFVRAAGFHLIATAKRGDARLIAVVMGARNPKIRAREAERLLERGFRSF